MIRYSLYSIYSLCSLYSLYKIFNNTLKNIRKWNNSRQINIFANRNIIHEMKLWQIGIGIYS